MRKSRIFLLLSVLMLGLSAVAWIQADSLVRRSESGLSAQLWIQPDSVIPAETFRWTWGVGALTRSEPDAWFFQVFVRANVSVKIELVWMMDSVIYQASGCEISDAFSLELPRVPSGWRWDWRIANPNRSPAMVYNFTVYNYSITYTMRAEADVARKAALGFGLAGTVSLVTFAAVVRTGSRLRKSENIRVGYG